MNVLKPWLRLFEDRTVSVQSICEDESGHVINRWLTEHDAKLEKERRECESGESFGACGSLSTCTVLAVVAPKTIGCGGDPYVSEILKNCVRQILGSQKNRFCKR